MMRYRKIITIFLLYLIHIKHLQICKHVSMQKPFLPIFKCMTTVPYILQWKQLLGKHKNKCNRLGPLARGPRFIPSVCTCFLEDILYGVIPCSTYIWGKGLDPFSKWYARLCWVPMGNFVFSEAWMGRGPQGR